MPKNTCTINRIIKHRQGGYGFKLSFNSVELAKKYKEAFTWYIRGDSIKTIVKKGVYE